MAKKKDNKAAVKKAAPKKPAKKAARKKSARKAAPKKPKKGKGEKGHNNPQEVYKGVMYPPFALINIKANQ